MTKRSSALFAGAAMLAVLVLSGCVGDPTPSTSPTASLTPSATPSETASVVPQPTDTAQPRPPAPSSSPSPSSSGGGKAAAVSLQGVFWDATSQSVIGQAFVTNIIESNGSCTLTLSRSGAADVKATVSAYADATVTYCRKIIIPKSSISPGTWTATIAYSSPTSSGTSSTETVQVPS